MKKIIGKVISSVSKFIASIGLEIFIEFILLIIGIAFILGIHFLFASPPQQPIDFNALLLSQKIDDVLKKYSTSPVLKNITIGSYVLDEISIKHSPDKNGFQIFNISFKAYGGTGTLKLSLSSQKQAYQLKARLNLSEINTSLMPRHEKNPLQKGTISLKASLNTKGESPDTWLSHLNGTWKLNIQEGVLNSIDIKEIIKTLENLDFRSLLHLRKIIKKPGPIPFTQISGHGLIKKGVVETSQLNLSSSDITANAKSLTIHLVQESLNATGTISFCNIDIPPVEVACSGPLKKPKVHFDALQWVGKLIEKKTEQKIKETIKTQAVEN